MYRNYFVKFVTTDEKGDKKQEGSIVVPMYFWQVKNMYSVVKAVLKRQKVDYYTVMIDKIIKL